ncbi:MAG: anti-sigma factor antagonist [Candidatus Roseilinea sp.]|jgi:anti-sigma B factor antagonist|nr:MAG: anti-sigma factor antagonist [Candidatus Roseilinea sp.]
MQISLQQIALTPKTEHVAAVIGLSGRFDAHEVPRVRQALMQAADCTKGHVIVDLGGVNFIDSSGLACLVQGMKYCRECGADQVLCNLQQPVRIIFELTRLDRAFRIARSVDEATTALAA